MIARGPELTAALCRSEAEEPLRALILAADNEVAQVDGSPPCSRRDHAPISAVYVSSPDGSSRDVLAGDPMIPRAPDVARSRESCRPRRSILYDAIRSFEYSSIAPAPPEQRDLATIGTAASRGCANRCTGRLAIRVPIRASPRAAPAPAPGHG